jgi:sulfonate transport system ATP-binding protein
VFQEPRLVPWKRVLANVVVGLPRGAEVRETGRRALAEVGLERHAQAWPATLSGGEAQRVALARALVREPELLLLDEPFAALDALTRLRMQDLVGELCRVHRPAVLLVTHDVDEAIRLADRVAVLRDGRLVTDERIGLDHPRDSGHPRFAALRSRLLADLGVHAAATNPHPGTDPDPTDQEKPA